jgi:hypothetical protein
MGGSGKRLGGFRSSGLRAGIVVGSALALIGAAVGTTAAVDTMFQKVVVVNAANQAIPVSGTVNVGNAPSNQSVTVTNFPTTQTVSVSNLPTSQTVSGSVRINDVRVYNDDAKFSTSHTFTFPDLMHVTGVTLSSIFDDSMNFELVTTSGTVSIHYGEGFSRDFTAPVAATGVVLYCGNLVEDCIATVTVFGY